ncbi:MAG TPA: serine/threonine-protein kinase [Gemmatimonadaceae bacterium]|nr:serine/threonine-protein kinase [Gemmatimonadaceae bacterium]
MTDARWQRVKAIFAEAMERPVHERGGYLDAACADDPSLRADVASLLAAGEDSVSLPRARAAVAAAARSLAALPSDAAGDSVLQRMLESALGQQYEIVRPLGQGGMGAVYLARERALERFVAIKVLRPELAEVHDSRERFRREARIAAQLSHPGILPLYAFGEVGGIWYFVMGYVRGASLGERLRLEGRFSVDETHRILSELADALECAHRSGIVHRDIKPANVLLDADSGRALLADFGIAKIDASEDHLTASGVAIGTPHYMSPEQVLGERTVDERSDVYSLGAVGYTMLAGREPFAGEQVVQLMRRRIAHDPPPLAPLVPVDAAPIAAVVMRCLAREPAQRWQSARELRAALARARGSEPGAVAPARELPAFGPYALLWATLWTALALRPSHSLGDTVLLLLIALIVPFGFAVHVWNVGGGELPARELARLSFWPPEWWGMWWPAALRRPNDLYATLPGVARRVRIAVSAFIAGLPTLILVREWLEAARHGSLAPQARRVFLLAEALLLVGTGLAVVMAVRWARSHGASWPETLRLLFGSTAPSSGWSEPRLSGMLSARAGAVRAPRHDDAHDHVRAIVELAASLPPFASDLGVEAERAARTLGVAIGDADREIAALSRHGGTSELDRLVSQLGALESSPDSEERRELSALLQRQIDVVQRMHVRCELLTRQRARMFELTRGLWRRLALVRDAAAESSDVPSAQREHLRAVLGEIEKL